MELLARCGIVPYSNYLKRQVALLKNSIDSNGIYLKVREKDIDFMEEVLAKVKSGEKVNVKKYIENNYQFVTMIENKIKEIYLAAGLKYDGEKNIYINI